MFSDDAIFAKTPSCGSDDSSDTSTTIDAASQSELTQVVTTAAPFMVRAATLEDARVLQELYDVEYIHGHRVMHAGKAGDATVAEWEGALGPIDFAENLKPQRLLKGSKKRDDAADGVHIFTCVESGRGRRGRSCSVVGYVVYQFRERGPKTKRQRWCELVNIVVGERWRGQGAGRILFEGLRENIAVVAPSRAGDSMRLYVAEHNLAPQAWYHRLGFTDSGWQSEKLNGVEVKFQRMILKGVSH